MAEVVRRIRLGEILVSQQVITPKQLDEALARSKAENKILGEVLVSLGMIKPMELLRVVGQQIGLPAVELRSGMIDAGLVRKIPKDKAQHYGVIPMFLVEDRLTIAISHPLSIFDFDDLERITGGQIQLVLCQTELVRDAIGKHYGSDVSLDGLISSLENARVEFHEEAEQTEQLGNISEDSPIAGLVNYVLTQSITDKASDIHIEPDGKIVRVRYRVDGVLREMMTQKIGLHPAITSRIKVMAKMDIAERRRPQDGRIQAAISGRDIDVRVSTLPTTAGEKVVMRILDSANLVFDLEQLGFRAGLIEKFRRMLARPHGLLLVTGPTGSGKTTTLYSALQNLRSPEKNIITIEDPVEYQLPMVNQVQVNEAIDLRFSTVLRTVLRQDPNIIMIGEIRDQETAKVAVEASLTGHLVLSTLHTNDSLGAITRLVNMGVEPFLVGSAVIGVVAQRLARKICSGCKTVHEPNEELRAALRLPAGPARYYKGSGCPKCFNSGYRGRVGLYELFEINQPIRRMLEADAPVEQLRKQREINGETTLFQEGITAATAALTSLEEVMRVAWAPSEDSAK